MERSQQSSIQTIVQEMALVTAIDQLELPPRYRTLESDTLDAAIRGMSKGMITVESDSTVRVFEKNTREAGRTGPATDDRATVVRTRISTATSADSVCAPKALPARSRSGSIRVWNVAERRFDFLRSKRVFDGTRRRNRNAVRFEYA